MAFCDILLAGLRAVVFVVNTRVRVSGVRAIEKPKREGQSILPSSPNHSFTPHLLPYYTSQLVLRVCWCMDLLHDFLKPDERREADLERLAVKRLQSVGPFLFPFLFVHSEFEAKLPPEF